MTRLSTASGEISRRAEWRAAATGVAISALGALAALLLLIAVTDIAFEWLMVLVPLSGAVAGETVQVLRRRVR